MFDVEMHWAPRSPAGGGRTTGGRRGGRPSRPGPGGGNRIEPDVVAAVQRALREQTGDVLVFLPGIGEIRRSESMLRDTVGPDVDVFPLAGALSLAEQDAALAPSRPGRRRVVLSTDIAETSLTVDGVRVVVDSGLAREPRFDARSGMTRLTTVATSRASAEQRAGRAGRTEPGAAYRLWSKIEHGTRAKHRSPEIAQADLAGFALELAAWGGGDELRFIDPPPAGALAQARQLLVDLHAIDDDGSITPLGRNMLGLSGAPSPCAHGGGRRHEPCLRDRDAGGGARHLSRPTRRSSSRPRSCVSGRSPANGVTTPLTEVRSTAFASDRPTWLAGRGSASTSTMSTPITPAQSCCSATRIVSRRDAVPVSSSSARAPARGSPTTTRSPTNCSWWPPTSTGVAIEPASASLPTVDTDTVIAEFGTEIVERRTLEWDTDRDDLVEIVERRLGSIQLGRQVHRPEPSGETTAALMTRVRSTQLGALRWSAAATSLRERVAFLHRTIGDPWPDWSDRAARPRPSTNGLLPTCPEPPGAPTSSGSTWRWCSAVNSRGRRAPTSTNWRPLSSPCRRVVTVPIDYARRAT